MGPGARLTPRSSLPLLLAMLALLGWTLRPGSLAVALSLLFCPGWGLTRCCSVLDRGFGVFGCSLALSSLVLGTAAMAAPTVGLPPERLGVFVQLLSVALCLVGRVRLAIYDRWHAIQPPHPAPMPTWPARSWLCLLIASAALLATLAASPPLRSALLLERLDAAVLAQGWGAGGEHPLRAGVDLPKTPLLPAAAAGLAAASGIHVLAATQLLVLAALLACLALVAESIARLSGNRGAPLAMLGFLLGLNPLALVFLLGAPPAADPGTRLTAGFDPELTTALAPFAQGSGLALTLAFTAQMLFATLSLLRRASRHVPRLLAAAAAGLLLADPRAALLLFPGWLLGLLLCWRACRDSPDNSPFGEGSTRRPGEPLRLRAPFWSPALHLLAGAALAAAFVPAPAVSFDPARIAAWGLLAALGPSCLLFMPGVRHLNATPGREAYFFVGCVVLAAVTGMLVRFPGDQGNLVARLLALLLVPAAANGAMKLVDLHGSRARLLVLCLLLLALPGPFVLLAAVGSRPQPIALHAGLLAAETPDAALGQALATVRQRAPSDAVLLVAADVSPGWLPLVPLLAGRPLLLVPGADPTDPRAALLASLATGDGTALARLRGLPGLEGRDLWAVHAGRPWPGFVTLARHGGLLVEYAQPPDIVLVTVASLRNDRLQQALMPQLAARARHGLRFRLTLTPSPETGPGLASLLTGRSPVEHDLRAEGRRLPSDLPTLEQHLARRGYRSAAVVALDPGTGLLVGFDEQYVDASARAERLVDEALARLARADARPLFLWLHLADLELPYVVPESAQTLRTGSQPFPADGDVDGLRRGVAAWPPNPRIVPGSREIDVERGLACYDALVGALDVTLGRLLRSLPADDVLVLTAPHGTSLDEHQAWFQHGPDLFEPSLRVPLILCGGGLPASETEALASLEDLSNLLLAGRLPSRERVLLESGPRPGLARGTTLPARVDPAADGAARRIWGERGPLRKVLLSVEPAPGLEPEGVAYDLRADPDELHALPAERPDLRRIDAWRRRGNPPPPPGPPGG